MMLDYSNDANAVLPLDRLLVFYLFERVEGNAARTGYHSIMLDRHLATIDAITLDQIVE